MRGKLSDSVLVGSVAMVMEQSRPCTVTVVVGVGGVHSVSSAGGQ